MNLLDRIFLSSVGEVGGAVSYQHSCALGVGCKLGGNK